MLLELRQLVTAEAEAAARLRESGGAPPGAARHVLAKLQAELEAADVTALLPRVREVLEAVRQGHALLHALRTALALPAAASMHECAAAATRAHAAAATLSAQARSC